MQLMCEHDAEHAWKLSVFYVLKFLCFSLCQT